ncbi:hypothetical protein G6F57_023300 [Rhizopus arrhizus]|nr:hypothetical protein G6F57_023300 [Rhizopus arrhizus]
MADRQHHGAHAQPPGGRQRGGGQGAQRAQLQHGQIGVGVGAHHLGGVAASVGQGHLDRVGRLHDVVVRQHVAVLVHDDARAQAGRGLAAADARNLAEQLAQHGIVG